MQGVMIAAFILLVLAVLALGFYLEHQRREMWRRVASRYGFRYSPHDPFDLLHRYNFAFFSRGSSRKVYNCLDGDYQGLEVILFDYRYSTGSGKNRRTHSLSGLIAKLNIDCPHLAIRREGFMDRLAGFLGFDDIDFEYEEFNRAFHVQGDDKKFAYDICHPETMEYLLEHPAMSWELRGRSLLLFSDSLGRFDPEEVATSLEAVTGFVARIPDYLHQE